MKSGRICLELIATVHGRFGELPKDDLTDKAGLGSWLNVMRLAPARPPAEADVRHFQGLREAIFRLVSAVSAGSSAVDSVLEDDIALVNRYARGGGRVVQLRAQSTSAGRVLLAAEADPPAVRQVLTMLAQDAVDLLAGPDVQRLHQCQASSCGTFYLDTSRGGQRRWCSSASCGNRARVAAFRDRNRT